MTKNPGYDQTTEQAKSRRTVTGYCPCGGRYKGTVVRVVDGESVCVDCAWEEDLQASVE